MLHTLDKCFFRTIGVDLIETLNSNSVKRSATINSRRHLIKKKRKTEILSDFQKMREFVPLRDNYFVPLPTPVIKL